MTSLVKQDAGTWIFTAANTYTSSVISSETRAQSCAHVDSTGFSVGFETTCNKKCKKSGAGPLFEPADAALPKTISVQDRAAPLL